MVFTVAESRKCALYNYIGVVYRVDFTLELVFWDIKWAKSGIKNWNLLKR